MIEKTMNKEVAYELAIGFLPEIHAYIERNKDAYIKWLKETGNTDNTITAEPYSGKLVACE